MSHLNPENKTKSKTVFKKLDASEEAVEENGVTEIDSVCMNCYKTGRTKLMLTRIPFYRDVIISSFLCEHCHYQNNGIESANKVQDFGIKLRLWVKDVNDLNREMIKSDYALFRIPVLDFEIPPMTQKGFLTTVEGIIDRTISNLEADVEIKKEIDVDLAEKIKIFAQKLGDLKEFKLGEFEIILDDPSGDSFIENPHAPNKDPNMIINFYKRNAEQNEMLGLTEAAGEAEEPLEKKTDENDNLADEIVTFQNNCPNCNALCDTNIKPCDIPYFKKVIIMCTACDSCGVKSSEIKSGTGIEEKGTKFTLKITDPTDLNRDLLKSEYATFEIPELEFYMNEGTLGGKFTTIEGLVKDSIEQLDTICPFFFGDSEDKRRKGKLRECLDKLESFMKGEIMDVTVILDDPTGNSYLQNVYAPEEDPNMKVEIYERDFEQNELLGLNDMKTENY